jgi:hypothetical protein
MLTPCPGCGEWFDMRDLGQVFLLLASYGLDMSVGFF